VRVACILTWAFSAVTAALCVLVVVAVAVDRDEMLKQLRDNPDIRESSLSNDSLVAVLIVMSMVIVVWCIAAVVLAVLTWRRYTWAWITLLVSAGFVALFSVLAFPVSLVHLAASGTALGLLMSPPTRAWFRDEEGAGSPPPPPGFGQGWPPPGGPPAPPSYPEPPPVEMPKGKPPVW
jgi:hypothetical protein